LSGKLGASIHSRGKRVIQQIIEAPDRWPVLEEDIRQCLTRVFPDAVLYSIETEYVLIISTMHSHREPGYWGKRNTTPANSMPDYP
jgi:hypothetical protein